MPYEVTNRTGATGLGEVVWSPGQEPLLCYDDFLWTAAQALQQELECEASVPDHPTDDTADTEARRHWEEACVRAVVDQELADAPPEVRASLQQLCLELFGEALEGDGTEEAA